MNNYNYQIQCAADLHFADNGKLDRERAQFIANQHNMDQQVVLAEIFDLVKALAGQI